MADVNAEPAGNSPNSSPSSSSPARGWKKGLPTWGLKEAEEAAGKLWDVARRGMTAKMSFAKALGMTSTSGGAWDRRIAHLRGFDLIKVDKDEIGLSDLGLDLVQDHDPVKKAGARRTAFYKLKAYRELVEDFDGTELPQLDNIASKMEHEYGKTRDVAEQAAGAFVASLREARLLDPDGLVRKAGVEAPPPVSAGLPPAAPAPEADADEAARERELEEAFDAIEEEEEEEAIETLSLEDSGAQQVSLSVSLDLSTFRADEVIEILRVLGLAGRG